MRQYADLKIWNEKQEPRAKKRDELLWILNAEW